MAINTNLFELKAQCEEWIGLKGGLALTETEFREYIPNDYKEIWDSRGNIPLRIHSEQVEELFEYLAINLGIFEKRPSLSIEDIMLSKIGHKNEEKFQKIATKIVSFMDVETKQNVAIGKKALSFKDYIESPSFMQLSLKEKEFALDFISALGFRINNGIWTKTQIFDDIIELKHLFDQYSTIAPDGHFFDQRYIKYLDSNFNDIDKIHWRKFEELTAEFFLKHGYQVELGSGTNDGGVDIRIWSDSKDPGTLRIIQCKRWKNPVNIELVKAFAYDAIDQNAEKGFMVTTSSLVPGASKLTAVRDRKIIGVERENIKQWLKIMRKPDLGKFVGLY